MALTDAMLAVFLLLCIVVLQSYSREDKLLLSGVQFFQVVLVLLWCEKTMKSVWCVVFRLVMFPLAFLRAVMSVGEILLLL